jgi:hypothetical protein
MPVTTEIGKYLAVMGSVVITGLAPQPYLEVGRNQRRVRLLEYYRSLQHSDFWELERPCGVWRYIRRRHLRRPNYAVRGCCKSRTMRR